MKVTWRRSWPPSGAAAARGGRRRRAFWSARPAHGWAPAQDRDRRGASARARRRRPRAVAVLEALIASDAALARDRDAAGDAAPLGGLRRARECRGHGLRGRRGRAAPRRRRRRVRDDSRRQRRHSLGGVAGGRGGRADAARGRRGRARRQRPRVHLRALGGGRRRPHRWHGLSTRRCARGPPGRRTPRATPLEHAGAYKRTDIVPSLVSRRWKSTSMSRQWRLSVRSSTPTTRA